MSAINRIVTLEEMRELALRLAPRLRCGDVVTLSGDLGAGKTTFAQFLIGALCPEPVEVTSPTFTLLQTYPARLGDNRATEISHYDLYRIEHSSALAELGLEEALQGVTIIEWPERLSGYKYPVTLALIITLADDQSRRVAISGEARLKDHLL